MRQNLKSSYDTLRPKVILDYKMRREGDVKMKVEQLIEILKKMPKDATVLRYDGEYFHEEIELDEVYMRNGKVELK
jgi:hypothetical protein